MRRSRFPLSPLAALALLLAAGAVCVTLAQTPAGAPQKKELPQALEVVHKLKGHGDAVYALAYTPDGKYILTGSFDQTLKMWEVATGKEVRTFGGQQGHTKLVLCVAVSPNGQLMASGGSDNTLKLWDVPSNNPLKSLANSSEVNGIALSPDGLKLAAAGKDGVVQVWNTKDNKELFKLTGHAGPVLSVAFSVNGAVLVSSGADGTLRFWNPANGQPVNVIGAHAGPVNAVAINPNNAAAYSAGQDGSLRFWQMNTPGPRALPPHPQNVVRMELSPDGNQILSVSADKSIRISNFGNGAALRTLLGNTTMLTAATLNPNAALVAGGTEDGQLLVWSPANVQPVGKVLAHQGKITAVSIRPANDQLLTAGTDGMVKLWALPLPPTRSFTHPDVVLAAVLKGDATKLYTASKDKNVRAWNLQNNQMERQFSGHTAPVTAVAVSPNGQVLASGGEDATLRFWNPANGQDMGTIGAHQGPVTALAFAPNGTQAVSAAMDGTVAVWQVPPPAPKSLAHPDQVASVVLTPDGTKLITGCNDKQVRVWNLANGAPERALPGHALAITAVAVSGDGKTVAGGSADKSFSVWNLANGQLIKKITVPAPVTAVQLSTDGKTAVVGLEDKSIRVFNVADGKETKALNGHEGPVSAVLLTAKGDQVISASADKTVRIWNLGDGATKLTLKHSGPVTCLALSKDGNLVAGGAGQAVKVWKLADGKEMTTVTAATAVKSLAFAPDGSRIVTGETANSARVYDLGGKLVEFFPHNGPVLAVAYHPGGKQLVTAGADKLARVWTSPLIWAKAQGGRVRQVIFNSKGTQVVAAGDNKTVTLWNAADGKEIKTIPAHDGPIAGLGLSADTTRLATAGADKKVRVWDLTPPKDAKAQGKELKPLTEFTLQGAPQGVALSPDGKRLAVSVAEDKAALIRVFDLELKREIQTLADHKGPITSIAFHSDNKTIVSASADKTAVLAGVGVVGVFEAHPGGVIAAQFHGNGTQALTAGADKTVKTWDLAKRAVLKNFPVAEPAAAAVYSRDYTQIGAAAGQTVYVWNAADGRELAKLTHPAKVSALSFSTDKSRIVTGAEDKQARVWEVAGSKLLQFFPAEGPVPAVFFHPNNTTVVAAGGKTVAIGTLAFQKLVPASGQPLLAAAVTVNGSHVLTGGADQQAKLWNTANGNADKTFAGATGPVRAVALAKNNILVAVAGADKMVRVYKLADGKEVKSVQAPGEVRSLTFSPNSLVLAATCTGNTVIAWDVSNYNPGLPKPPDSFLTTLQVYSTDGQPTDVVFAPDNATVYAGGLDKALRAWKLASPAPVKNFPFPNIVDAVVFSTDGKFLACAGHDGKIRIFDSEKQAQLKEINAHAKKDETMIYGLAFSPDSKQIVSASADHSLKLFDVASGNVVREFKAYKEKESAQGHKDDVFAVAFSPDGKFIASGSGGMERVIKIWTVADGKVVRDFDNPTVKHSPGTKDAQSHPGWIYNLRFTKDGKHLISAGDAPQNKGYLAVWTVADGKLVSGQELPLGAFYGLALSPDGNFIALGAGPRGRPTPEFNSAYVVRLPALN